MQKRFFYENEILDIKPCSDGGFYVLVKDDEFIKNSSNSGEMQEGLDKKYKKMTALGFIEKDFVSPENLGNAEGFKFEIVNDGEKFDVLVGRKKQKISELSYYAKKIVQNPYSIHNLPAHIFNDKKTTEQLHSWGRFLVENLLEKQDKLERKFARKLKRVLYACYYDFENFYCEEKRMRQVNSKTKVDNQSQSQPD